MTIKVFKKWMPAVLLAVIMLLGVAHVSGTGKVSAAAGAWTNGQSGVEVTDSGSYKLITGTAGQKVTMTYSQQVNFTDGAHFRYYIVNEQSIDIDANARANGKNYIKIKLAMGGGKAVEFVTYSRYSSLETAAAQIAKMQTDIFIYDPAITADGLYNDKINGVRYLETIETYKLVSGTSHYVDIHKEEGMWFFAFDGLTAIPVPVLNALDLSDCTVTMEYYTATKQPQFRLYDIQVGAYTQFIQNDFVQFGSDEITPLADDTVKFGIRDKRAEQYPGALVRYREQLISAKGYDVRKPINIEYSYDVSNASAVWYAVGLGRPELYDTITKLQYNVFNLGTDPVDKQFTEYSDNIASKNDGIMFQTTTGIAQPTYAAQNSRLESYFTNSASKPYDGRERMDTLTFIVGETGTDLYHNGVLLFDGLVTKLSDFADSGYMAYPYFHFFEDNASKVKGNTIVIKGINAPQLITEDSKKRPEFRVVGGSNADLTVDLKDNGNGALTLWGYDTQQEKMVQLSSDLFTYNAGTNKFTLKYAFFTGKSYDVHKVYVRNDGGSEEIAVRFTDPGLQTLPPTSDKAVYTWQKGDGATDLVVNIDIKNAEFSSFSGGGIMMSQYTYTPGTDGAGTITIAKSFLANKKKGEYTFTLRTKDIQEDEYQCQFKVAVYDEGDVIDNPSDPTNPDGNNPDGSGTTDGKRGCKGESGTLPVLSLVTAGVWAAITVLRKKNTP